MTMTRTMTAPLFKLGPILLLLWIDPAAASFSIDLKPGTIECFTIQTPIDNHATLRYVTLLVSRVLSLSFSLLWILIYVLKTPILQSKTISFAPPTLSLTLSLILRDQRNETKPLYFALNSNNPIQIQSHSIKCIILYFTLLY
jgi:hypothetical protein